MNTGDKKSVILLGSGITLLGTIRALKSAKIDSNCISAHVGIAAYSRFFKRPTGVNLFLDENADLALYLSNSQIKNAVLIGCSDHWVKKISELPENFRGNFYYSRSNTETLESFLDKSKFNTLLNNCNIPHPKTVFLNNKADIGNLTSNEISNYFIKPCDSQSFFSQFGVKAIKINSKEEAVKFYDKLNLDSQELILQEYISGSPDSHYFIDGCSDSDGEVIAAFARQRLRIYPENFGNSTFMTSISLDTIEEPLNYLKTIFKNTSYHGIYSAEFAYDKRDNLFKLLEINIRPWWYIEFAAQCGVNTAKIFYNSIADKKHKPTTSYKANEHCIYPYYDYHAIKNIENNIGFTKWIVTVLKSKQATFNFKDPCPAMVWFIKSIFRYVFKHTARFSKIQ